MSITLEECIKMLNSYAKSARNIAKDCLNKDGRHKLIKTAEKYEQEAEWLKELAERRKQPEIVKCKDCENWDTTWQNDSAPNYHYCPMMDGTYSGDFYCGKAERRTDEQQL